MALATTAATSPSRVPSEPVVSPTRWSTPHGPPRAGITTAELGSFARQDRERRAQPVGAGQRAAAALLGRVVGVCGDGERGAQDAERARSFDEALRRSIRRASRDAWKQAVVTELPDRHEVMVVGVADQADGTGEVVVEVVRLGRQTGDGVDEREVDRVALRRERIRRRPRRALRWAAVEQTSRGGLRAERRRPGPDGGPVGSADPDSAAARKRCRSPRRYRRSPRGLIR